MTTPEQKQWLKETISLIEDLENKQSKLKSQKDNLELDIDKLDGLILVGKQLIVDYRKRKEDAEQRKYST